MSFDWSVYRLSYISRPRNTAIGSLNKLVLAYPDQTEWIPKFSCVYAQSIASFNEEIKSFGWNIFPWSTQMSSKLFLPPKTEIFVFFLAYWTEREIHSKIEYCFKCKAKMLTHQYLSIREWPWKRVFSLEARPADIKTASAFSHSNVRIE